MFASGGQVRWNTGATGSDTVSISKPSNRVAPAHCRAMQLTRPHREFEPSRCYMNRQLAILTAAAVAVAASTVGYVQPASATFGPHLSGRVATAGAAVLIDESFSAPTTPPNFGFPVGAEVTGGVLNVTKGMGNHSTSVKALDAAIVGHRTLDLTFDWKTAVSTSGNATGVELRDSKGNLVFALAGTTAELRYALTGPVSDSTSAPDSLNPTWTRIGYDRAKWYTVNLHMDFTLRRVQYTISTRETATRVMASARRTSPARISRSSSPPTTTAPACSPSTTSASPRRKAPRMERCEARRCTRSVTASWTATPTRAASRTSPPNVNS